MRKFEEIKAVIAGAPVEPGVYLMKDPRGRIIYIGKAKSIRARLNNYLSRELDAKTVALMSHVVDIEFRPTRTESLALLLESGLIHEHKPKYNVALRDDKSFPMVKITNEEFPAVCVTRTKENDGARYFGPYINAGLLREALKIIRRQFPYRGCKEMPREACMYYRIGLSPAPCAGKISRRDYRRTIRAVSLILEGKTERLVERLTRDMRRCSGERRYEEAARIRDQITAVASLGYHSTSTSVADEMEDLKRRLGLTVLPERIEAFDISNIQGAQAAGSMVSFWRGSPDKNNYRRFRIKTVEGIDDYKMLAETVRRRYLRLKAQGGGLPHLILVDGGKAHLMTAIRQLESLGVCLPVIGIAKERERVYTPAHQRPLNFPFGSPALNLLRRVRDEAHRFALAYHHVLHRKKIIGR